MLGNTYNAQGGPPQEPRYPWSQAEDQRGAEGLRPNRRGRLVSWRLCTPQDPAIPHAGA